MGVMMASSALAESPGHFENCLRFHILAADDSFKAQNVKLAVRDAIIEDIRGLFSNCDGPLDAWRQALESQAIIEKLARDAAAECGFFGNVTAWVGIFEFDEREYMGRVLPAGDYRAIRIELGEGQGHNWWCLLYPRLCLPETYEPGMPVKFYSSIFRWLHSLLGGGENE